MKPKITALGIFTWLDHRHWLWLILAAPFMLFPTPTRVLAMLVVPSLWLIALLINRKLIPLTPLNGVLLLLSLMVLVSTWATYDIAASLPKISGMVLGLGAFFATVREGRLAKGWWLSFEPDYLGCVDNLVPSANMVCPQCKLTPIESKFVSFQQLGE